MNRDRMTLASFLAKTGIGSRRACEKVILDGEIKINGVITKKLAMFINPDQDRVTRKGRLLRLETKRYLLLHKPKGYVCTSRDKFAEKIIFDLLKEVPKERLFTVGRLDKNSEGLLLITNDGLLANAITHPRFRIEKKYLVKVRGNVLPNHLRLLENGIIDDGQLLKAVRVKSLKKKIGESWLEITVCEGKKREIRRMCRYLKYRVLNLTRTAIGPLRMGKFKPGFYRELTESEVSLLQKAVGKNQAY